MHRMRRGRPGVYEAHGTEAYGARTHRTKAYGAGTHGAEAYRSETHRSYQAGRSGVSLHRGQQQFAAVDQPAGGICRRSGSAGSGHVEEK